jgi:hypothetical protein
MAFEVVRAQESAPAAPVGSKGIREPRVKLIALCGRNGFGLALKLEGLTEAMPRLLPLLRIRPGGGAGGQEVWAALSHVLRGQRCPLLIDPV